MKSIEEIKTDLETVKPELIEDIMELIQIERDKGITEKSKVNREAENLRKYKKAVEALGYTKETDLDMFTAELISKKTPVDKTDSLTIKAMNDKIKNMEAELNNERNAVKVSKLSEKLNNALSDKLYGHQYVVKNLINEGQVDLVNGEVVFKNNDEIIDFKTGIENFIQNNKDMLKTVQTPGTGTVNKTTVPNNIDQIIHSGDMNLIRQNKDKIFESYGLKKRK